MIAPLAFIFPFYRPKAYESLNSRPFRILIETTLLTLIPTLLAAATIITTAFDKRDFAAGETIAVSNGIISVVLSFCGGLVLLVIAFIRAFNRRRNPGFWFVGWFVINFSSAVIVIISTMSHLHFVAASDTGKVSFGYFRDQVKDMRCDSDVILYRWNRSPNTPLVYRCPNSYVLNPYSIYPFMPWPEYTEGNSADLAGAMNRVLKDAEKPNY